MTYPNQLEAQIRVIEDDAFDDGYAAGKLIGGLMGLVAGIIVASLFIIIVVFA